MPGGLGHLTYVALGKETAWGAEVTPSIYIPVLSVKPEEKADTAEDEALYGVVGLLPALRGAETVGIEMSLDARPQPLCHILRSLCGPPTSTQPDATGHPNVWRHTFKWPRQNTFSEVCRPNPYTIDIFRDLETVVRRYPGCGVSKLGLAVSTDNKLWRCECSWVGKAWPSTQPKGSPTYPSVQPWMFSATTVTVAGGAYSELQELSLEIDEKLEGQLLIAGSRVIEELLSSDMPEAVLSGTALPRSVTEYEAFRSYALRQWEILATGETISGTYTHQLKIVMPKVMYTDYPIPVSGPERLTADWKAAVYYDDASQAAIIFEITTTVPGSELA